MLTRLTAWAKAVRRDVVALWLASRDPRVPPFVKTLAALTAAYALSPIDLIPDFILVVGYLDEMVLLPLAIAGLVRLIDPELLAEHRAKAHALTGKPVSRVGAVLIAAIWLAASIWLFGRVWPDDAITPT